MSIFYYNVLDSDININVNNNDVLCTFTMVKHLCTLPVLFIVFLKGDYYHSSFSDGVIKTQ